MKNINRIYFKDYIIDRSKLNIKSWLLVFKEEKMEKLIPTSRKGRPAITCYRDYIGLSGIPTCNFVMVSELIDNAIASKEEKETLNMENWKSPLYISIELNVKTHSEKLKAKRIKWETETVIGTSLIVKDNAYGIPKDKIYDALTLNKKNDKSTNRKNLYGRGLKQSAFWWGIDLTVTSKTKNNECYWIELCLTKQKEGQKSEVWFNPIDKDHNEFKISFNGHTYDSGTEIKIENLYLTDTRCLTKQAFEEMLTAIWFRYKKYINNNEKFFILISYNCNGKKVVENQNINKYLNNDEAEFSIVAPPTMKSFFLNENLKSKKKEKILVEVKDLLEKDKYQNSIDNLINRLLQEKYIDIDNDVKSEYAYKLQETCDEFTSWIKNEVNKVLNNPNYQGEFTKVLKVDFPDVFDLKPFTM